MKTETNGIIQIESDMLHLLCATVCDRASLILYCFFLHLVSLNETDAHTKEDTFLSRACPDVISQI